MPGPPNAGSSAGCTFSMRLGILRDHAPWARGAGSRRARRSRSRARAAASSGSRPSGARVERSTAAGMPARARPLERARIRSVGRDEHDVAAAPVAARREMVEDRLEVRPAAGREHRDACAHRADSMMRADRRVQRCRATCDLACARARSLVRGRPADRARGCRDRRALAAGSDVAQLSPTNHDCARSSSVLATPRGERAACPACGTRTGR